MVDPELVNGALVFHFVVQQFLNFLHAILDHYLKLLLLKLKYLRLSPGRRVLIHFSFAGLSRNELRLVAAGSEGGVFNDSGSFVVSGDFADLLVL